MLLVPGHSTVVACVDCSSKPPEDMYLVHFITSEFNFSFVSNDKFPKRLQCFSSLKARKKDQMKCICPVSYVSEGEKYKI